MEDAILNAIERVEMKYDIVVDQSDLAEAIFSTLRKMLIKKKEESYLPLLFETELDELVMRREINRMGAINQCAVYV